MNAALPTHRQILSSLITSVCQPPPQSIPPLAQNPSLKASIPPSRRQFLLTLHVLFPTLLLPALDLLDRELITCLSLEGRDQNESSAAGGDYKLYVVKSLASTLKGAQRRRASTKQDPEKRYLVRLKAWNCTCAGFALEAYGGVQKPLSEREVAGRSSLFGGLSLLPDAPCCKHILACLLAENWEAVLSGRIEHRSVTKEELAGIVAST